MALSTRSINLDREDLAVFLPNLRAIKAFENLAEAVSQTLPDAVNTNTAAIASMNDSGLLALGLVRSALGAADRALAAAARIEELLQTQRSDRAAITTLARQVEELRAIVHGR